MDNVSSSIVKMRHSGSGREGGIGIGEAMRVWMQRAYGKFLYLLLSFAVKKLL